jgi:alpha,alpha-trehalose phosphorylase
MPSPVTRADFDAVLFDLDGVLTTTRTVHAAAWKRTFDDFLTAWDAKHHTSTAPFDEHSDYAAYVDGKPRQEGVRDFLAARGMELAEGTIDSPPEEDTVWGLSNRKQLLVEDELERSGVEAFPGSVAWVRELREAGLQTAVVSSSRNCARVLELAGIATLFDARVDGETALELGLPGKPAPDMFLEGARRLGTSASRSVVVEDALAGVQAGRAGGFGLVIGVDRADHADALAEQGADVVVSDLSELLADPTEQLHRSGPGIHHLVAAARRIMSATGEYPPDPWRLIERSYNPDYIGQTETLFALSNGLVGIRGAFEEGTPSFEPGTLLNGFHETWPIVYPELAHGFATTGQTILGVPDGTTIRLFNDEDPVTCANDEVAEFERTLDMQRGTLSRTIVFQLADGRRFRVESERFVSLAQRHLACIRYQVTALDEPIRLVISSDLVTPEDGSATALARELAVDPRASRRMAPGTLRLESESDSGERVVRTYRTARSGQGVSAGVDHVLDERGITHVRTRLEPGGAHVLLEIDAQVGETVGFTKWLAYHHGPEDAVDLADRVGVTLDRARANGLAAAKAEHEREVADFWERSNIVWEGSPAAQQALHYTLFTLMQASMRSEDFGVPAKGLTGTGYEGHYFWDTEVYVVPFLTYTSPEVARSLLMHRVRMLPQARERARAVGCEGALFPWRTINGEEASAYYAAGTAQYHIDADVAFALMQYVEVTGDTELLRLHGVELLVETARMWAGLGFFSDRRDGRFVINKVTGPDEYSTVVDNNLFTNLMAAENLRTAADALAWLRAEWPGDYEGLVQRTGLLEEEEARWRRAAELMYIPYDDSAGVHLQDDGFLDLEPWDFAGTPEDHYPLLLHYHPLVIYRHQVIKQADVVLATVLLPDRFTREERQRIFDYYDPITTGDSSLSECIQAIAAADVGKYRSAEEYLIDAAAIDMADRAGNLRDGVHVASAGGTWLGLINGFAGFRWRTTSFAPMLPTRAQRIRLPLRIRGSVLDVDIRPDEVTYSVREGGRPLTARHYDTEFTVEPGAPVTFPGRYHTSDASIPASSPAAG